MKHEWIILIAVVLISTAQSAFAEFLTLTPLTPEEERIIVNKGTERPFSGKYDKFFGKGTYVCRRCGTPLYSSDTKFDAGCGWPAFDQELPGAVKRLPDPDGQRTEIQCAKCGAHLGHVFLGERLTEKNTRHCVNSISMVFVPDPGATGDPSVAGPGLERAVFAGGCFWGVEYQFRRLPGVVSTRVGYVGGLLDNPTYEEVCQGNTGHAKAVEVVFDTSKITYENVARHFFEIHDPTQLNRQGPDIGLQYRSSVFYLNERQKAVAEKLVQTLKAKGYAVVTELKLSGLFWPAETYHQQYYDKKGSQPYCHAYTRRF